MKHSVSGRGAPVKSVPARAAVAAAILVFPAAAVVGLLWRFPVPFGGYVSGLDALLKAPVAAVFYMIMGGVVAIPLCGAALAWAYLKVVHRRGYEPPSRAVVWGSGALVACAAALLLAALELLIGKW